MSQIPGTNIIAPVVPFDTNDVHPSHEARYGKGGYRTVATLAERDAIPSPRLEAGMLVYVQADGKAYQLGSDLTTWSEFKSGASTWSELAGKPETFPPEAHSHSIADVTGLSDDLASKVPLAGGAMNVNAALTFSNGTADSEVGAWGFGVEVTGDASQYATVEPTAVTVHGASGGTTVTPSGITLANATQVIVGSFDNSTGGANGLGLICAVGYELNWQGGRLKSVYNNLTQTIHVDSPIQFEGGVLPKVVALGTGGGSMPTDASLGEIFTATADANTLIENPTNPVDGKTIRWKLSQDGTGGHTWTLGSKFVIPSSASSPLPWSTTPNATDLLAATYDAGRDKWDIIAFVPGY